MTSALDRSILRLAVPALGSLVAEPLFLLTDSALVGHLGAVPLAGLALGGTVLQTIVGLMVFLAYSTTPRVGRALGEGDERRAVAAGIDGGWLALLLGAGIAVVGALTAPAVVALFGAEPAVAEAGVRYLAVSMAGIPAMLGVFALTGLLRGFQDTRTPLVIAAGGFALNAALNAVLIYPAGLGITGSALGTVIAQWAMLAAYAGVALRLARRVGAPLRPHLAGLASSAGSGGWMLLRTASLRAAILLAVATATSLGAEELGAFQVAMTLFSTVAFALDAVAIAAQALLGRLLGAGDAEQARAVTKRCVTWGIGAGVVLGALVTGLSGVLPYVFSSDPEVLRLLPAAIAVVGLTAPLGGYVFVLDGVLIGAGDGRYLALSGLANLAVFVPLALLAPAAPAEWRLLALWLAFAVGFLGARAVTLGLRVRSDVWLR
ncbi:MATE family efflux transporter [Rathayibacter sp. AY1B7]|uniref:MATE family efflux transporter n=1 Tax=unclassified Rathayibacter TaxID=2609250 RepID=UPI000CE8E419|nr:MULTISPECIES: MATE family efflux transporter [unclassified Rathayibacter]PPF21480.1 MATE family efflux transporter [Rathayibacter sp. AY1A7]PPF49796.1 MATE family efflux transporter [Rathayibacter sp. AY1A1]PPF58826.1 MATE family efflux transporter [Rathayibacter sp. AY1C2]PPH03235.1 MATE family efflux transporter [Rathayibacter sp. AY1G9]PPH05432.1 MATE family efflux transporter [Rathayibacter sp. AY1F6]